MALLQDPVLGYHVCTPYAARVYDAAPAPRNRVLLQGPLRKVYSISKVYGEVEISQNFVAFSEYINFRKKVVAQHKSNFFLDSNKNKTNEYIIL